MVKWLTMSIALLLVSLRFYIRGILRKNLGWDDYTILLAMVREIRLERPSKLLLTAVLRHLPSLRASSLPSKSRVVSVEISNTLLHSRYKTSHYIPS